VRADPCPTILGCGDDLVAANTLEAKIADHFHFGQVFEVDFGTPSRPPGDVASLGGFGDSGLWTGVYLAAESFRYAVAKDYLADPTLTPAVRAVWQAHRNEARARVRAMVAKYHLLTNIATNWQTAFNPSLDPPSFGGGVIRGEPGMLMRACVPTDAPANLQMPDNIRVFGPFRWEDGKDYRCETAPSRDTYAGTTFGLLTAFDLVAVDDAAMRRQIRDDIVTLGNFLLKWGWNFPRPHGNVSIPPFGHDFDNFISPLFVYVPAARLNMTQAVRHVTAVAGPPLQALKWQAVWLEEVATQTPILAASMQADVLQPNDGYYKFNLHHLTGFNTARLERNPIVRLLIRQAFGVMDKTTRDDVNAHFEAITYALTGDPGRRGDAVSHLRQWRDYRARIDLGGETDNLSRCGAGLECVPQDQYEIHLGGHAVVIPGTSAELRARHPLPVAERPPTDFLWQRAPTQLNGSTAATFESPGVDYLLPYWMLRYYTEVTAPRREALPAWPGPSHS
jgi:hypothetical protein